MPQMQRGANGRKTQQTRKNILWLQPLPGLRSRTLGQTNRRTLSGVQSATR